MVNRGAAEEGKGQFGLRISVKGTTQIQIRPNIKCTNEREKG